jgi:hypothetical protein
MRHITLLTAPECDFCRHARKVLERVALDIPLAIETLALDSAEGRAALGARVFPFPPVTLLDGQPYAYGRLSERKLRRDLALPATDQPLAQAHTARAVQRKDP